MNMKNKFFSMALGIYNLVLALGFTCIGVMMISSKSGIFGGRTCKDVSIKL